MRYLDVCSGISAPTVAWKTLGWECAGFFEIDPFACDVLKHHYPDVPNFGNLLEADHGEIKRRSGSVDVAVGGTPCQGFSLAGKRRGLADPRSDLTFAFFVLARAVGARWIVWENVPGVLSDDRGRTFKRILSTLCELGYSPCWRVLDARFFGVPQRRRRVFIVGYLGDWRPSAAVLFEPESLRRDPAESRKKRSGASTSLEGYPQESCGVTPDPSSILGFYAECGSQSSNCNENFSPTLKRSSHGVSPIAVAMGFYPTGGSRSLDVHENECPPVKRECHCNGSVAVAYNINAAESCAKQDHAIQTETARCLDTCDGFAVQQGGTIIGFSYKDHGADAGETAPTLRSGNFDKSWANGGVPPAIAYIDKWGCTGSTTPNQYPIKFDGITDALNADGGGGVVQCEMTSYMVRRLSVIECERLQGFPDNYTLITKSNGKPAADGPRYKALGNSMAVPVVRWIGRRIALVDPWL